MALFREANSIGNESKCVSRAAINIFGAFVGIHHRDISRTLALIQSSSEIRTYIDMLPCHLASVITGSHDGGG